MMQERKPIHVAVNKYLGEIEIEFLKLIIVHRDFTYMYCRFVVNMYCYLKVYEGN